MRIVLDTNVLVAALLNPGRVPDRAIAAACAAGATMLTDARIGLEYREVLARPKLRRIDPALAAALLAALDARGEVLDAVPAWEGAMIDGDDRAFVEVALAGAAHAVVTGNATHYPTNLGFEVLSPAELLARIG